MTASHAFDWIWKHCKDGDWLQVADGYPCPRVGSLQYKVWRSHNFAGPIISRGEVDGVRYLEVEYLSCATAHIRYVIQEDYPHTFAPIEDPNSS